MATLKDLAEFFPRLVEATATYQKAEGLRQAFEQDFESLRAQGLVSPLESAEGIIFINAADPPQVYFSEEKAAIQRLLMSRSRA